MHSIWHVFKPLGVGFKTAVSMAMGDLSHLKHQLECDFPVHLLFCNFAIGWCTWGEKEREVVGREDSEKAPARGMAIPQSLLCSLHGILSRHTHGALQDFQRTSSGTQTTQPAMWHPPPSPPPPPAGPSVSFPLLLIVAAFPLPSFITLILLWSWNSSKFQAVTSLNSDVQ